MRSTARIRSQRTTRPLVAVLLAVCVMLHFLLGSLSELHEFADHGSSALLHHDDHASTDSDHHDPATPADSGSGLHGIMHLEHCCGHGGSAVIDQHHATSAVPHQTLRPQPLWLVAPTPEPSSPFRPPIAV